MSDAFRLLTNSINFKKPARVGLTSNVPSISSSSRPPPSTVGSKRSSTVDASSDAPKKKRKRSNPEAATAIPTELDFFGIGAPKEATGIERTDKDEDSESEDDEEGGVALDLDEQEEDKLPTEEENRRILREHKLKFTLLTPPTALPAKKSKKDKKKRKPEKAPKKQKLSEIFVPPLTDFSHLRSSTRGYNLSRRIYENILAQGYKTPTEVQMGALPVFMKKDLEIEGADGRQVALLACAPTGSGKTLAYVLPVLDGLLRSRKKLEETQKGVKAVILAPTKELVGQIENETRKLALGTGIRVSAMKKGSIPVSSHDAPRSDTSTPEIKTDILVSTPLVFLHALETAGPDSLKGISDLILDEADVLLDELFRTQTLSIWSHLRRNSPTLRSSLWSATISSSTEEFALRELPQQAVLRLIVGIKDTTLPQIQQSLIYTANESGKLHALRQLFTTSLHPPILIFLQTIPRAQALYNEVLYDLPQAGRIAVLHSGLTDTARAETMTRFRNGEVWVLITTDLLARGMDWRNVRLVINYDIPGSVAAYIHRVGRTGRRDQGGEAVTYYTKEDIALVRGVAGVIQKSKEAKGEKGEEWLMNSLPKVGKRTRVEMKRKGGEENRGRISTKSGWERGKEWKKREAVKGSKRRKGKEDESSGEEDSGNEVWEGIKE